MKITKLVLFLFIFCLTCNTYIFAEDTTSKPITLEETRPKPTVPTKPKAPSRTQVQAYYNGECPVEETSSEINLSGLKKGVYIISLEVDRYIIDSKRIIK